MFIKLKRGKGFSLYEVMVVGAMLGLVLLIISTIMIGAIKTYKKGVTTTKLSENINDLAYDIINDANGAYFLRVPDSKTLVVYRRDYNYKGEVTIYTYSAAEKCIKRQDWVKYRDSTGTLSSCYEVVAKNISCFNVEGLTNSQWALGDYPSYDGTYFYAAKIEIEGKQNLLGFYPKKNENFHVYPPNYKKCPLYVTTRTFPSSMAVQYHVWGGKGKGSGFLAGALSGFAFACLI